MNINQDEMKDKLFILGLFLSKCMVEKNRNKAKKHKCYQDQTEYCRNSISISLLWPGF